MIDFSNVSIKKLSIHFVGNKSREEGIFLTKTSIPDFDTQTERNFIDYFLTPFLNSYEFFSFYHSSDIELNEIRKFSSEVFLDHSSFHKVSEKVAKLLYENSLHPNINGGEFYLVYLKGCSFNNNPADAIGIFKSESKDKFIKFEKAKDKYEYQFDTGVNINNLGKGCIVFNIQDEYKILIVDNINKSSEAKYWVNDFLKLSPCNDSFHNTKDYLDVTKNFVAKRLSDEFDVSLTDKADFLNKSINFFKDNEKFDEADFLKNVFNDKNVIKSFTQFKEEFISENNVLLEDNFEISNQAVKKQTRAFKSILKLDKNFHIYIHGNREWIEQGIEKDGRKFYKIYFEKES